MVVIGSLIAVASSDIAANTLGAVNTEGVFEFPKAITGAIEAGVRVYWDDTAEVVTTTEGTPALTQVGYTVAAAAETDPTVLVKLEHIMTKLIPKDDTINYTPSADVTAGDVVVIGSLIAVASSDIAADTLGAVNVEGVFELPKAITGAIEAGVLVYWDDTAEVVTTTEGTPALTQVGYTVAAAGGTDPTVLVKLER